MFKSLRFYLINILVLILGTNLEAQNKLSQPTYITIQKEINYKNGREVFSICKTNPPINFGDSSEYFWYNEYSGIKSTKGGAGGNLLHGICQFYDEEGNLIEVRNFFLGIKNGEQKLWDKNGEIKNIYKFKTGICFYAKLKNEKNETTEWIGRFFRKGSKINYYNEYMSLTQKKEFLDNDLTTKITDYFLNGRIERELTTVIGGAYTGSFKEYYENGNIKEIGIYGDIDQKDGDWKYYNENGTLKYIIKHKIFIENHLNGKLKIKGSLVYNDNEKEWLKDGSWCYFKENGRDYDKIVHFDYGVEESPKNNK